MGLLSWVRGDPHASLKAVVGDYELPHFPVVTLRALELIRDEDSSLEEIAQAVSGDPASSVRLLATVNSAAFALRRPVDSIDQAVCLIGRNEVESLLISMAVGDALPGSNAAGFDPRRFWAVAALRAVTARTLAEDLNPAMRSLSFTAGLLQDMAVPILAHQRGGDYCELLERWHDGTDDLAQLERRKYDWDHTMVASWMCAKWEMPKTLSDAIGAHHGTAEGEEIALAPVSLVSHLREVNEELGFSMLASAAERDSGIAESDSRRLIEGCQENSKALAALFA